METMLSLYTYFSIPSFFKNNGPKTIDIPPVQIYNIETEKDRRARVVKHLLKLNHASHAILYHNLEYHNHLPHILGSAYLFGSNVICLEKIYDEEACQLEKWRDSPGEVSSHDWRDFLGDRRYQRAFVDFFEDELVNKDYDWRKMIDEYLFHAETPLINNVISGLAHPLIHLGYAFELNSKELAVEALSLAATCYNFLHKYIDDSAYSRPVSKMSKSPLEILERVHNDSRFDNVCDGPGSDKMETLFQQKESLILDYWNSWDITNPVQQFRDSQWAAAGLLSATVGCDDPSYDFFLVHALTGSHAVRIILPFIPAAYHLLLLRQWWLFTLAVYITQMRPVIAMNSITEYDIEGRDWTWVDLAAIQSKWSCDAHFVKALRALKEAAQTWGDEDTFYLKAAIKFADQFNHWFGFRS